MIRVFVGALIAYDLAVLLTACAAQQPAPPSPLPLWDGGDGCEAACARRDSLGCLDPELRAACVPVCQRAAIAGLYSPACVVAAATREELGARCRVRCGR